MQKIYLGSDHAGFSLKEKIAEHLRDKIYKVIDLGTNSNQSVDYPDFAEKLSDNVAACEGGIGILICGSGIGMSIAANRHPKIRAALCHNASYVKLAREHNDANVLVLGARFLQEKDALEMVDVFLSTEFLQGRHKERVQKLTDL
ncbi:ribose 5-phosphate isomerase B [Candidatus Jidaibacter acanthamoebae]|nr:ribose 5-phosphate isomerase B [Candidatus Jidaibacter acanthamoeba]